MLVLGCLSLFSVEFSNATGKILLVWDKNIHWALVLFMSGLGHLYIVIGHHGKWNAIIKLSSFFGFPVILAAAV